MAITATQLDKYFKGDYLDIRQLGCNVDGLQVSDGAISTGTPHALHSASGLFSAVTDVGKYVFIAGAGSAGAGLSTTITAVVSATQVTIAGTCLTTVTGAYVEWGTDDTVNAQKAINAAAAASIPLMIPGGYGGPAMMIRAGLTLPSNLILVGRPGAQIRCIANSMTDSSAWIQNDTQSGAGNSFVRISGIEFDGNRANQGDVTQPRPTLGAGHCNIIYFNIGSFLWVEDCRFINAIDNAVYTEAVSHVFVRRNSFSNWNTGNCYAIWVGAATATFTGVAIQDNWCDGTVSESSCINVTSVLGSGGGHGLDVIVSGNICFNTCPTSPAADTLAIQLFGDIKQFTVANNVCVGSYNPATWPSGGGGAAFGISCSGTAYGVIQGNFIYGSIFGIECASQYTTVTGNALYSNSGIIVQAGGFNVRGVLVTGNLVYGMTQANYAGIQAYIGQVGGNIDCLTVSGNVVLDVAASGTGIQMFTNASGATVTNVVISGNVVSNLTNIGSSGIALGASFYGLVYGNSVNCCGYGIYNGSSSHCQYLLNLLTNCTTPFSTAPPNATDVIFDLAQTGVTHPLYLGSVPYDFALGGNSWVSWTPTIVTQLIGGGSGTATVASVKAYYLLLNSNLAFFHVEAEVTLSTSTAGEIDISVPGDPGPMSPSANYNGGALVLSSVHDNSAGLYIPVGASLEATPSQIKIIGTGTYPASSPTAAFPGTALNVRAAGFIELYPN